MPDRAHNETLDVLVTGGALGLAAHLALLASVLFTAMQCLGLVATAQRRSVFWISGTTGGLLASAALWFTQGPEFIGIALPLGILAGTSRVSLWARSGICVRPKLGSENACTPRSKTSGP